MKKKLMVYYGIGEFDNGKNYEGRVWMIEVWVNICVILVLLFYM